MNKEELKNFHYNHKNEIQFEYGGQVHHYNMDNLKEVIITAWKSQERVNKAIGHINACGCELSTNETKYLLEILKGGSNEDDPFLDIEIDEEDLPF